MRKVILTILGLLILFGAIMGFRRLTSPKEGEEKTYVPKVVKVYTIPVQNGPISVDIELSGRLEAVNEIDIYSETQGVFYSGRPFRPGTRFNKGDLLIGVDATQELATLKAQRAALINQIVQFLPDIKFDYADEYDKWSNYVSGFDVEKTTPPLPQANSEREKFFIAGKNISASYYNIKNLEARLSKYRIYAPFSGVLTDALVTRGALIRPGQKLGTLTGQSTFELALPIREAYAEAIKIGSKISVTSKEDGHEVSGKVVRINPSLDPNSQSLTAYVEVKGNNLKEGMFFTASLPLKPIENAMEIDRKLVVSNQFVYGVQKGKLVQYDITPEHYAQETVVVTGLKEGQEIIKRMIPGAREGMPVEIVKE